MSLATPTTTAVRDRRLSEEGLVPPEAELRTGFLAFLGRS